MLQTSTWATVLSSREKHTGVGVEADSTFALDGITMVYTTSGS